MSRPVLLTKTFVLAMTLVVGYYVLCGLNHHVPSGLEVGAVGAALAALVYGNDKGAAAREEARNPTPRIEAPGSRIDAPAATIET